MIIKIFIFESEDAMPEFIWNRIALGKTPLPVIRYLSGQQFAVFIQQHRAAGLAE
jgi:hypothetical protein